MKKVTEEDVKAFDELVKKSDVFINRYQEGHWLPDTRELTVLQDVPGRSSFVVEDPNGKVTTMSAATLIRRYEGPLVEASV